MEYDLIVIGAGPGGYVAAIRAGQTGLKTAIVEKADLGGMCLNWGCIPTKALLESAKKLQVVKNAAEFGVDGIDVKKLSFNWDKAVKRTQRIVKRLTKGVEFLLKKNGVDIIKGTASINMDKSVSVENMLLKTKSIIIATGSKPAPLDLKIPAEVVQEVEDLLKMEVMPENPVVYGNGPHAVELAQFFLMAGKKVTLITEDKRLIPEADEFLSDYALGSFKKSKMNLFVNYMIRGYEDGHLLVEMVEENIGKDEERFIEKIPCDKFVNAAARMAVVPVSARNLERDHGYLKVNDRLKTSADDIYAVGDVNGRSIFAHAASAQGIHVVNQLNGIRQDSLFDMEKFPINIYTHPEMAQIGLTEAQVKLLGTAYKVSEFPLSANGKAQTEGNTEGMVRMISDRKYGEVLGVQIVAPNATDMIAEASAIMQMEGTIHDVARTIHAHPTISEVFLEAGFDAFDQAIHK